MSALSAMPNPEWLRILSSGGAPATETLALSDSGVDDRLRELYTPPKDSWVRMNMIGSLNGRVTGPDDTSDSLSNRADRRILGLIRQMSDAIIVGAQTVRQEQHTATRPTWLCVVTKSGDLTGHRISAADAAASVIVTCPADAKARVAETMPGAQIAVVDAPAGRIRLADVLSVLHDRGHRHLVVEGGNRLISQFLDEDRLDEICVTQAPVFAPNDATSLPGSESGAAYHRELLLEDAAGYLYQRLFTRRS